MFFVVFGLVFTSTVCSLVYVACFVFGCLALVFAVVVLLFVVLGLS